MSIEDYMLPEAPPELVEITVPELPADKAAEATILGAVLLDNNALLEAAEKLESDDFYLDSNRRIFLRMLDLSSGGHVIDIITLANNLRSHGEIESAGGVSYIASLTENLPRRPVIDEYIRIVKDKSMLRKLISLSDKVSDRAMKQDEIAISIASFVEESVIDIIERGGSAERTSTDVAEATMLAMHEFEVRRAAKSACLSYGMPKAVDELTGGMFEGEVTVVGGESGVGKSSCMVQALVKSGMNGDAAVCYSLEMTKNQLLGKIWSIVSGVPYKFIRFPHTASEEYANRIRRAAVAVGDWNLHIYDRGGMTLSEIISTARMHIKRNRAKLICIDYLQRIVVPGSNDERLKISEASKRLADLIKNTGAHLMLLSQLKRKVDNSFPTMRDLRESGQIENDAHCIVLLWREYDKDNGHHKTNGMILVPKQRFGFTGNVKTTFNKDTAVFE